MPLINNVSKISHESCTGCRACADVCSKKCINFISDGIFLYPKITEEICISCGKCLKVCPAESVAVVNDDSVIDESIYYYAWSTDDKTRLTSTSGGVGTALTKYAIDRGYYVCGATLHNGNVQHIISNEEKIIEQIKGSKYVESNLHGIYQKILNLLKNGEKVLFFGTPCSVSAILKFIPSVFHDNLLTCEIVCHGVNSSIVWKDYFNDIQERYHSKVVAYNFRSKSKGWGKLRVSGTFENGKSFDKPAWKNQFHVWFGNHYILRHSCLKCQYRKKNRQADLIIGDFWGIEKVKAEIPSNKGVNLLITRTSKGLKFVNGCTYMLKGNVDKNKTIPVLKGFVERKSSEKRSVELKQAYIFEKEYLAYGYQLMKKMYPCPSPLMYIKSFIVNRIGKLFR